MPRVARKAKNQALFREVNDRIASLASGFEIADATQEIICECHRVGCTETVELPLKAYAEIREDPTAFVVVPGHEDAGHETVASDCDSYLIVRNKPGLPRADRAHDCLTPNGISRCCGGGPPHRLDESTARTSIPRLLPLSRDAPANAAALAPRL